MIITDDNSLPLSYIHTYTHRAFQTHESRLVKVNITGKIGSNELCTTEDNGSVSFFIEK
jgi:hypothetical protein